MVAVSIAGHLRHTIRQDLYRYLFFFFQLLYVFIASLLPISCKCQIKHQLRCCYHNHLILLTKTIALENSNAYLFFLRIYSHWNRAHILITITFMMTFQFDSTSRNADASHKNRHVNNFYSSFDFYCVCDRNQIHLIVTTFDPFYIIVGGFCSTSNRTLKNQYRKNLKLTV